jgi:uncharacterized membrane protein
VLTLAAISVDENFPWLTVVLRWVHIISACLAIGGPFMLRYVAIPTIKKNLAEEAAEELRQKILGRWKFFVQLLIAAFLITGGYSFWINFQEVKTWPAVYKMCYHAVFGLKIIAAFAVFFIASALVGRSQAFEKIRKRHKIWTTLMILLAFSVVLCGNILNQLHVLNRTVFLSAPPLPPAGAP